MPTIAIFSPAPGTGATTTALNLLAGIARRGIRPLGIDLDPDAALTRAFGLTVASAVESSPAVLTGASELVDVAQISASGVIVCPGHSDLRGIERVVGRGPEVIARLAAQLDDPATGSTVTVVDCGTAFGVTTLTALFACDLLLVPVSAEAAAIEAADRLDRALPRLAPALGKQVNRRRLRTRRVEPAPGDAPDAATGDGDTTPLYLETTIREDAILAESAAGNADVFRGAPESAGAADYGALVDELVRTGLVR